MSAAGKDPRHRAAERFAERHARTVLARTDVRVSPTDGPGGVDLTGPDFAARVDHEHRPVERTDVEQLHAAAGTRAAAFYSRSGYTRAAQLWADEHRVSLFGYTDDGFAAPFNQTARELVLRGQNESEHRVRSAAERVARNATAARLEAERFEREAHAAVLRAEEEDREAAQQREIERVRDETLLGRTLALLLEMRRDPATLGTTVHRLTGTTAISTLADSAHRLTAAERPPALALVRSLFDEAAAVLEVLTPPEGHDSPGYRAARSTVRRGMDAVDAASGRHGSGHISPDDVAGHLRIAERRWRMVVDELVRLQPWAARLSTVPDPRHAQQLVQPSPDR
ncbi:hypothetical protein [Cellulomonas sp. URHB0016]